MCAFSHDEGQSWHVWCRLQPSAGTTGFNKKAGQTVSRRKNLHRAISQLVAFYINMFVKNDDFLRALVSC